MSQQVMTLEEGWEHVEEGITKLKGILDGNLEIFNSKDYMLVYTTIYNMCTQKAPHNYTGQLYEKYREIFEDYIQSTVLWSITEKRDEFMLRELVKRWDNHKLMVRWLSHFFHYIDRYFTARRSLPSLQEVGLDCFRVNVYEEVKAKARDAVLVLIDKEREGEQIDRALMKNVADTFAAMKFDNSEKSTNYYEQDFEKYMLEATSAYYSRKASKWILEFSCPEYMLKSEECLKGEKERLSYYLQPSTGPKLIEKVQHELLVVNCSQLLEKEHSGCIALIRDGKMEDLSRMYNLFRNVEKGLDRVAGLFKQHITAEGVVLVKQAEDASSKQAGSGGDVLIAKIIELHDKYMDYVLGCFHNHTQFHKALKEAFEVFCNKNVAGASSAELLSAFCDNVLKKGGSEKLSDEAIEKTLEKVLNLLRYVSDKDLFAEFSRKQLARRLLFDRSASDEHEKSFLTKLRERCGAQFTSKMEGMITDTILARENQSSFEENISQYPKTHPGIDLSVTVLTTGFWPSYKSSELILPKEMVKGVEAFKQFYDQKAKHRRLTWIYSLGSCNVVGKFAQKPIEMIVSTYQAAILLLFNNSDTLSYSDIMAQSNMSPEDLGRLLHSLSCSKYKILNKVPETKTISNTDIFEFNSNFTDRMRRIKIPLPPVDERKKVVEDVDRVRPYAIDAAVVRIMKTRKVLGHQQLVLECVDQLKGTFKPDIKAIKKRIEDLVSRDFLERDEKNPNVFKYVA